MEGWISIYRQIVDNWIWKSNEPFDKRSAWIDLLLMVNHKNEEIEFNGKTIVVERGQRITSIDKLSDRWKWSRHKVSNFLNQLEKDKMIVQIRDNKKTLLSIENYSKYQFVRDGVCTEMGHQTGHQVGHQKMMAKLLKIQRLQKLKILSGTCPGTSERTGKGQQKDTNNNDNNIYLFLFNKYKGEISGQNFGTKIKKISELKSTPEYNLLSKEEQNQLYIELMSSK